MFRANKREKKMRTGQKKQLRMYINKERETHMIVRASKKREIGEHHTVLFVFSLWGV
jgi:hypothetical protein